MSNFFWMGLILFQGCHLFAPEPSARYTELFILCPCYHLLCPDKAGEVAHRQVVELTRQYHRIYNQTRRAKFLIDNIWRLVPQPDPQTLTNKQQCIWLILLFCAYAQDLLINHHRITNKLPLAPIWFITFYERFRLLINSGIPTIEQLHTILKISCVMQLCFAKLARPKPVNFDGLPEDKILIIVPLLLDSERLNQYLPEITEEAFRARALDYLSAALRR